MEKRGTDEGEEEERRERIKRQPNNTIC